MAGSRVLVTAALLALVLGPVSPAAAHDVLVGTGPVEGSSVQHAPASVALEFSDAPQSLGAEVVVSSPYGAQVSAGGPELDGTTLRQRLRDRLPAGAYTVDWRATSADGHPLTGSFGFTVTEGTAVAATEDDGAAAAASPVEGSSFPVVGVALAGILVVAAGLVVRQLRRPV